MVCIAGDIAACARQLFLADVDEHPDVWRTAVEHVQGLMALEAVLAWRLDRLTGDDEPAAAMPRPRMKPDDMVQVPVAAEDHGATMMDEGQHQQATLWFGLLVASFPRYADGHNFLGLLALREEQYEDAVLHYRNAVIVSRGNLPARVAKQLWWRDHSTRPHMRGLRGLALTLNLTGNHADALYFADQLSLVCGDEICGNANASIALLAMGDWDNARTRARRIREVDPLASMIAGLASYELGDLRGARADFLYAVKRQELLTPLRH